MSAEENRELLERRLELWQTGNIDLVDELFAPDYVMHGPKGEQEGLEPFKQIVKNFHDDLSDLQVHYEHVAIGEDTVAYVWKMNGVAQSGTQEQSNSSQKVAISGVILARIEDGRFIEEWRNNDVIGLLAQLGIMTPVQRLDRMYPSSDSWRGIALH